MFSLLQAVMTTLQEENKHSWEKKCEASDGQVNNTILAQEPVQLKSVSSAIESMTIVLSERYKNKTKINYRLIVQRKSKTSAKAVKSL